MRQRLQGFLLVCLLLVSAQSFAQQRAVSGQVLDEEGMPIPGVSVYEKDTSNGTTTDFEGEFTINVAGADAIIVFSYVGFATQEVRVGSQTNITVTLSSDVQALEEVVVVGYGIQRRANLTGAVSTVDTEVLEARPITDIARGLQGTTPGLTITSPSGQIGDAPSITLRGAVGTLGTGGGAVPLILVDNVEVPNLNYINPQDVESISVLKDAASTSIYGARAAWGVVLITTKKGTRGTSPTVSYTNNFAWATPTENPEIVSAAEGVEMGLTALRRRLPNYPYIGVVGMRMDDISIGKMREWEEKYGGQDLGPEMVPGRDFEIRDGGLYFYRPWDARDMYVREWTPQQKHDLSVSGGSENTNYYLGLGYLGQEGALKVKPDQFDRYNLNLSVSTSITDWFEARANVLYSNTEQTYPYAAQSTYDPWYYVTRWPSVYPYGTYNGQPFRNQINEIVDGNHTEESNTMARLNLGTTITPIEDLSINLDFTHDRINNHVDRLGGPYTAINFWAPPANGWQSEDDLVPVTYSGASQNQVRYNSSWSHRNTAKAFATYNWDLNDDHNFKFMVGGDLEEYEYWYHGSERWGLMDPNMGELSLATGEQRVYGDRNHWATLGTFGRINYSFRDKFLLEVNGRYDGSSRLSANKQWAFFPSVSAGYVLTEENYMDFARPYVSFLKLRGSYGTIGNQNTYLSNIYRIISSTNSNWLINGVNQLTVGTPGALPSNLTWESVTTLDIGLDARFFANRLGLTFDWYERRVSDMHTAGVTLPSTFGTGSPTRNFGELTTTGWEVALDFKHSFDNGLNINATASLTDFEEKITKFANTTRGINSYYEGKVLGEIWGYETDRFFTEDDFNADGSYATDVPSQELYEEGWFKFGPGDVKYKDLNGDGVIDYGSNTVEDHGDLKRIGNTTPRYQYNFSIGADYKGFDFRVFMQGVGKRDLWANGPVVVPGFRYHEAWFTHHLDYWTPDNPDAFYPRLTDQSQSNQIRNFMPQTKYLLDMSYLRMKNITVGYSLPANVIESIGLNRLRIYLSGENLFEFTNLDIPVDPETNLTSTGRNDTSTFGRVYPFRRVVSAGLQVSL